MCACMDSLVVKMFHLLAGTCQDVPSLGREGQFVCVCVCVPVCVDLVVKIFHLLVATSICHL